MRLLLLTLLFAVAAPPARAQEVTGSPGQYTVKFREAFPAREGGRLHVARVYGTVHIEAAMRNRVTVEETVELDVAGREAAVRRFERVRARYTDGGRTFLVRGGGDRDAVERHAFRIRIPADYAVTVDSRGGDVYVEGAGGAVDVSTAWGDVEIRGARGDVDVHTTGGEVELRAVTGSVAVSSAGGDVTLDDVSGPVDVTTAGGEIRVARVRQDVHVVTAGGDVTVAGVGGRVRARTAGGDVSAQDVAGPADLATSGGEILLTRLKARVEATTSGGDITGHDLPGPLFLETGAGSIVLRDVRGPVEATAAVGDLDVELTLRDGARPHDLRLRTRYGDILLQLPEALPAHLVAEIARYGAWDEGDIRCDCALTPREDDGRLRLEGNLNGGGDRIDLYTTGGDITIRRR